MSDPQTNVSNLAGDSAIVGAQAQVIHGDVYTYAVRPSATAKDRYEVGVNYLSSGVPSLALSSIERAIAEGHDDTSEVRFHWLLALLADRTSRQLSSEDVSRLDRLTRHPAVYHSDAWADGIRAVLQLLTAVRSPGTDPTPFIEALEDLQPAQKEPVFQHLTVFLKGPRGNQIWQRDIQAAEGGRYAKGRHERVKYFFRPSPAKARARHPVPAMVSSWDYVKAFVASAVSMLPLLGIGAELVSHANITGVIGCLVGCGGAYLAAVNWVDFRWQARRRTEFRRLRVPTQRTATPERGFAARVDHQFDYYFWKHAPDRRDVSSWRTTTEGIRNQLRDEIVEIYREERVKADQLNWLISYEIRQIARRWTEGTLFTPPDDTSHVRRVPLWTGIFAVVIGGAVTAGSLLGAGMVGGFILLLLLVCTGSCAAHRWTRIALAHRQAASDEAESKRKLAERTAVYEEWREKLRFLKPSDLLMAEWLECDKKVILKRALNYSSLSRTDVISYAFLETPCSPYERASVRNGPWRYTRYKIIVFLLTADGIRQISYELSTGNGEIQQRDDRSYRYDAIASVEASVAKDGSRQEFKVHLVDGKTIPFQVAAALTDLNAQDGNIEDPHTATDVEALSSATEDATGMQNTLRILRGVAADGKGWIARETR